MEHYKKETIASQIDKLFSIGPCVNKESYGKIQDLILSHNFYNIVQSFKDDYTVSEKDTHHKETISLALDIFLNLKKLDILTTVTRKVEDRFVLMKEIQKFFERYSVDGATTEFSSICDTLRRLQLAECKELDAFCLHTCVGLSYIISDLGRSGNVNTFEKFKNFINFLKGKTLFNCNQNYMYVKHLKINK